MKNPSLKYNQIKYFYELWISAHEDFIQINTETDSNQK